MQKGKLVKIDGKLWHIIDFEHVKLGKGGAIYQTKLKNVQDGLIQTMRIRAEEYIEEVQLDRRKYEYLYSTGSEHVLMDLTSFEQITLNDDAFGEGAKYLIPNTQLEVSSYEGKCIAVILPNTVDLVITDTPPDIKGATATGQAKPATLETGLIVNVPQFIKVGEKIRVDTRTGLYVTRVKE